MSLRSSAATWPWSTSLRSSRSAADERCERRPVIYGRHRLVSRLSRRSARGDGARVGRRLSASGRWLVGRWSMRPIAAVRIDGGDTTIIRFATMLSLVVLLSSGAALIGNRQHLQSWRRWIDWTGSASLDSHRTKRNGSGSITNRRLASISMSVTKEARRG